LPSQRQLRLELDRLGRVSSTAANERTDMAKEYGTPIAPTVLIENLIKELAGHLELV
jgi:hypothetical protein